jgi:hypothetical protein
MPREQASEIRQACEAHRPRAIDRYACEDCIAAALTRAEALARALEDCPINWLYEMEPEWCARRVAALAAWRARDEAGPGERVG